MPSTATAEQDTIARGPPSHNHSTGDNGRQRETTEDLTPFHQWFSAVFYQPFRYTEPEAGLLINESATWTRIRLRYSHTNHAASPKSSRLFSALLELLCTLFEKLSRPSESWIVGTNWQVAFKQREATPRPPTLTHPFWRGPRSEACSQSPLSGPSTPLPTSRQLACHAGPVAGKSRILASPVPLERLLLGRDIPAHERSSSRPLVHSSALVPWQRTRFLHPRISLSLREPPCHPPSLPGAQAPLTSWPASHITNII